MPDTRHWTLGAARQLLPDVRARTARAVEETELLLAARNPEEGEAAAAPDVEQEVQRVVGRWAREMEALGLEVKGLWLVDFDTGAGYYCWRWPEEELAYFHGYEDGFGGRVRIQ